MAWTQSGNIRGASGVPGASGPPGATGPQGPAGPTGATGASGGTGGTGGPGTTSWNDITDKPGAILNYKGTWNVSTNTPTLSDSTGSGGDVYRVSVGGSRNLGSGTISWEVGDYAIWSPVTSSWEKADTTDAVSSVAGRTGAVTLTSADLGASGSASSSTFLRGDNTWATPTAITRSILTITSPTTLASAANTDYVYFLSTTSSDANFSNVVALLSGDGTNNSTTITDSSPLAANFTAFGNAKLNTTTKKFGTASISFSSSNSYLTPTAAASNFTFPGDFTIETWIYPNSGSGIILDTRNTNGSAAGISLELSSNALFVFTDNQKLSAGNVANSQWSHIALVRSGTTITGYVNGSSVGSFTSSQNFSDNTLIVGTNQPRTVWLNGFLDDLRITRGVARYTANFTAPTAAFPSGTIGTPTLPTATGGNTNIYTLRNISGSSITAAVTSSQQIDGATGGLAIANNTTVRLVSDGTGWRSV